MKEFNYVQLFADKLREDSSLFEQQKILIESQLESSRELFRKRFGTGTQFKINARKYLKQIGLI